MGKEGALGVLFKGLIRQREPCLAQSEGALGESWRSLSQAGEGLVRLSLDGTVVEARLDKTDSDQDPRLVLLPLAVSCQSAQVSLAPQHLACFRSGWLAEGCRSDGRPSTFCLYPLK